MTIVTLVTGKYFSRLVLLVKHDPYKRLPLPSPSPYHTKMAKDASKKEKKEKKVAVEDAEDVEMDDATTVCRQYFLIGGLD